jgi:hypothetical protein
MRTQLSRNFSAARMQLAAAALLALFWPAAAARAAFSDPLAAGPAAGGERAWKDFEVTAVADPIADSHCCELDFGAAGLAVTGPFVAPDGESGGMVFSWTAAPRDPAYLVTVTSLSSRGFSTWIAGDESLRALPDLGVVPAGNLSVFESGAVDVISWNFLEFSCALLALRLEDYARLRSLLERSDFDANASLPGIGERMIATPEPATSLLLSQGVLLLALLRPRRPLSRCGR